MAEERSLESWITAFSPRFEALYAFAKSPLPVDVGERQVDIERAIHLGDECGRLLADCKSYLTQHTAQAVLSVKTTYDKLNADERKMLVKDAVRKIQRLVDGLEITERAIKERVYVHMNANRRL